MKRYFLNSEQWIPSKREEVFAFFADPLNLEILTPAWLRFEILNPGAILMERGTRIDYRLLLHGVPMRWQSEIAVWEPPRRFIDEQRRGPYRVWIHEHTFEVHDGGTQVRDHVEYSVRGGAIILRLFVRRDLEKIFSFRREKLMEIFNGHGASEEKETSPTPGEVGPGSGRDLQP
jgi:hypothetical protein